MNRLISQRNLGDRGAVLVEFAVILPLILVLVFAGSEFSRLIKVKQLVTTISREAANMAFRECVMNEGATATCHTEMRNKLQTLARKKIPGTEVIISVYNWDPEVDDEINTADGKVVDPPMVTAVGINQTKFAPSGDHIADAATRSINIVPRGIIERQRSVVIGEAYVPNTTVIGSFLGLFRFDRSVAYDATIL